MKFKKSQSGRSMVEMLGVLAIIGVLSVGGIAGYSLSMRRHRANGVVDYVAKHSMIAYSKCQQKVLNGEADYGNGIIVGCSSSFLVPYDETLGMSLFTELGHPPAGTKLYHQDVEFNQTTKDESVYTLVKFSDQKLCQAVASIVGVSCTDNYVDIKIKQN